MKRRIATRCHQLLVPTSNSNEQISSARASLNVPNRSSAEEEDEGGGQDPSSARVPRIRSEAQAAAELGCRLWGASRIAHDVSFPRALAMRFDLISGFV